MLGGNNPAAAQVADKPAQISLPAGDLADALDKLGDQSGVQILYEPTLAKGIKVSAVKGTLTVGAALQQLLARTGLKADRVNENTVVLKRADANKEPVKKEQNKSTLNRTPQESTGELEKIVVSAQKKEERLQDVPLAVTSIDAQTLVDTYQLSIQEYYTRVPGLSLTTTGSGDAKISIRGMMRRRRRRGGNRRVGANSWRELQPTDHGNHRRPVSQRCQLQDPGCGCAVGLFSRHRTGQGDVQPERHLYD